MEITLDIPDELGQQLQSFENQIPHILELGLRELHASSTTRYEGAAEVLEILAGLPSAEKVLNLRPSEALQNRITGLLEKNRSEGLDSDEQREWSQYEYLEHLVRLAKATAALGGVHK